jgi:hypothetical protein
VRRLLARTTVDHGTYLAAVSHGVDLTGSHADFDRAERPVRLLATATAHTPELLLASTALVADAVAAPWAPGIEDARRAARTLSAGLVRLAHHALAVHARDTGYEPTAWVDKAVVQAAFLAREQDDDPGQVLASNQEASEHLADAIVALGCDRMAFPDHLTQAQAAWLACWCRARD